MKKKTAELKPNPKTASDLQLFQEQYGADWQKLIETPAFRAGLQLLNIRALDRIAFLSNEEVEKYSLGILSELIGQLKHEHQMFNLHNEKEFRFPLEEEDEYFSPEQVAEMETMKSKFREQVRKNRYGN